MHSLWPEYDVGSFLGFLPQFTGQLLCFFTSEAAELCSLLLGAIIHSPSMQHSKLETSCYMALFLK